jgi:hypothetical protein
MRSSTSQDDIGIHAPGIDITSECALESDFVVLLKLQLVETHEQSGDRDRAPGVRERSAAMKSPTAH